MRCLAVCLIVVSCLAGPELHAQSTSLPTYWRYSHPDAKALIGIDLRGVMASKFGQRLAAEFTAAGLKTRADDEGLALVSGVERLLLSSPGPESETVEKMPVVVSLLGRFDLTALRKFLKARGALRGGYQKTELMWPEKGSAAAAQDFCLALVSPQIILVGDKKSVKLALDHHASADPGVSSRPLYQRGVEMASGHDVWFVSELSPAVFSRSTAPGPMAVFDQVKRLDGGLSFRHGLGLELNLAAADHENAKNLAMGLQALLAMAAMSEQKSGSPAELLKKLVIAYEDRSVKLGLSFDQAELDRGIDSAKMALAQGISQGFSGLQPVTRETQATQPPRAPEQQAPREDPAQPKVIKIYNAEGGTREIQLSPR